MRNKILSLTRNVIPYVKELRIFTDSVVGCILMQQLDYWFERYPSGFYKFLEPSEHPKYVLGQSWQEEIGVSVAEFRTAFDRISTRWKSKTEFEQANDKFKGKLYASYQDKRANLTFYFRNHKLADAALDELLGHLNTPPEASGGMGVKMALIEEDERQSTGNAETQSTGDAETQSPVDVESKSLEMEKLNLQEIQNQQLNNTEITNTEITQKLLQPGEEAKPSISLLVYPQNLKIAELNSLRLLLQGLDQIQAQEVCDEIVGICKSGKLKVSVLALASGLVKKCHSGTFVPAAGISIARNRMLIEKQEVKQLPKPKNSVPRNKPLRDRLKQAGVYLQYSKS
ncbi:hypothetical protein [Methylophilus luteus]|uniref:Uncharacterized protein n=1 Tax=Methylophilus luteus TaxID=640108 RepID=A0ABW3F2S3_9PROT